MGRSLSQGRRARLLTNNSGETPDWVEQVKGQTLAFQTAGQKETIDLAPLYQNYDERYTVYWKVNKKTV